MNKPSLNQSGVVTLPMIVFSVLSVTLGISLWLLLHHWKGWVDTQLRLDRCTGEIALVLKSDLQTLESSNQQMEILRKAIATAMASYALEETVPPLQIALHLEFVRQEWIGTSWMLRQAKWVAQRGCNEKSDWALPLPSLEWDRAPRDEIGEQALDLDQLDDQFHIEVAHLPRRSAATIERSKNEKKQITGVLLGKKSNWQARWSAPTGELSSFRPSFH